MNSNLSQTGKYFAWLVDNNFFQMDNDYNALSFDTERKCILRLSVWYSFMKNQYTPDWNMVLVLSKVFM